MQNYVEKAITINEAAKEIENSLGCSQKRSFALLELVIHSKQVEISNELLEKVGEIERTLDAMQTLA